MNQPVISPPTVLFDGVCNLCNGGVQFIIKHERRSELRFAALQSEWAKGALGIVAGDGMPPASIVFLEDGERYTKSSAVARIAGYLRWPWSMGRWVAVIPERARDAVYDWVARHRYRWFGTTEACWIMTPELKARFVE